MNSPIQWALMYFVRHKISIYLLAVCVLVVVLGGKNLFDDEVISLNGDMPRYLMNGVFLLDVLRDFPLGNIFEYATAYYARYPALSLGHHPPLTPVLEILFYGILGISVFSGKVTILFFVLLGSIMWFRLIQNQYDELIAFLSTLLFITTPFIVDYSRIVMSEMPTLALMITASYYFQQFLANEKRKHLVLFAVSFALSVYAKQTAIILGLAFAWEFLRIKGFRKVFTKDILWAGIAFSFAMIPIGVMTFGLSPSNVLRVTSAPVEEVLKANSLLRYVKIVWSHHLTSPVLFCSLVGIIFGLWKRDRRCYFFLAWILVFYVVLTFTGTGRPRFSMFWIPAFCLFAASLVHALPSRNWRIGMAVAVLFISGGQAVMAYNFESPFARGYKEAAQYVVDNKKGTAVLYSARLDTGYFIFHLRSFDADQKMIVLLADKILATNHLNKIIEDRIRNRDGIYKVLKEFGVCHVIIEDRPVRPRTIKWLHEEVQNDQLFFLKKTIPMLSNDKRFQVITLKIYEYKLCGPPNADATLEMNLPLINHSIKVDFHDLVKGLQ